jgi:hypothetical protein
MLNRRTKFSAISCTVLTALMIVFVNATPTEVYSQLLGHSGAQITAFYNSLMANSANAPAEAVRYTIGYTDSVAGLDISQGEGVGRYNAATNTVEMFLPLRYQKDPIGAGWVIIHEVLHGVTGWDPSHALAGEFYDGVAFTGLPSMFQYSESIDHYMAYQINLIMLPEIMKEYNAAGKYAEATQLGTLFNSYREHYEKDILAPLTNANNKVVQVTNSGQMDALSQGTVYQAGDVTAAQSGDLYITSKQSGDHYEITVAIVENGKVSGLRIISKEPLTQANLAAKVKEFKEKAKKVAEQLQKKLAKEDLDKLAEKAKNANVQQVFAPSSVVTGGSAVGGSPVRVEMITVEGVSQEAPQEAPQEEAKVKNVTVRVTDSDGTVIFNETKFVEYEKGEAAVREGVASAKESGALPGDGETPVSNDED